MEFVELTLEIGLTLIGLGVCGLLFIALYCLAIFAHEMMMTIREAFRQGRDNESCDCGKQNSSRLQST